MFVHRSGFLILQRRFDDDIDIYESESDRQDNIMFGGLIGGFFTALTCVAGEFKKYRLIPKDSKISETWFNGTMCKVLFEKLYKMILFVDCKKNDENIKKIEEFMKKVSIEFKEKYGDVLEKWNRDMDRFVDFKHTIDDIMKESKYFE